MKPVTEELSHRTWNLPKIDPSSLKVLEELGRGSFGQVIKGQWNKPTPVAIKMLKPDTSMDLEAFCNEAQIMKKLKHPNIIKFYGVCEVKKKIWIITEFMNNGSLLKYLQRMQGKGRYLESSQLIDIAAQIASGMAYLESKKYIHRDLAARNVLVADGNVIKIADFGLARLIKEDVYKAKKESPFAIKWTAPEAVKKGIFSTKSDVWSFGITLGELVTYGEEPYPDKTNAKILHLVKYHSIKSYRMPCPLNCPDELYNIMLKCWKTNPDKRPTFEELQRKLQDLVEDSFEDSFEYFYCYHHNHRNH